MGHAQCYTPALSSNSAPTPLNKDSPHSRIDRLIEAYRRLPLWLAFMLAGVNAGVLALITGFAGGIAGMYLYDRAQSKGDDFAVGLSGFYAVETFVFVVVFSWLSKLHHEISSRTPAYTLLFCLFFPAVSTLFFLADLDSYYMGFVLAGWVVILLLGLAAMLVSRRLLVRESGRWQGF